jgi:CheY-like chemotaxis protein
LNGLLNMPDDRIELSPSSDRQTSSPRVLLIEDEAMVALEISEIVSDLGAVICAIARTRADAISLAQSEQPDFLIADIALADRSLGSDAVATICARDPDIRVAYFTGNASAARKLARGPASLIIAKPCDPPHLRQQLSAYLFGAQPA